MVNLSDSDSNATVYSRVSENQFEDKPYKYDDTPLSTDQSRTLQTTLDEPARDRSRGMTNDAKLPSITNVCDISDADSVIASKITPSEETLLDTYVGRIVAIEGEVASIQLTAEDGTEYFGTRYLNEFGEISIAIGSYFSCKTIRANGEVKAVLGPPEVHEISESRIAKLNAELDALFSEAPSGE